MAYRTRILEKHIEAKLNEGDFVIVEGSMGCGKSAMLKRLSAHCFDVKKVLGEEGRAMALDINPALPFCGKGIHGVDGLDLDYDIFEHQSGKTIFTSSRATGKSHFTLRTLSFYEEGVSSGAISLKGLFSGAYEDSFGASSSLTLDELCFHLAKGGYPSTLGKASLAYPRKVASSLLNGLIAQESKTEQSPKRLEAILKRYAMAVGTIEKNTDMLRDLRGIDPSLAESTLYDVINALRRLLILDEVEAWYPPIKASPTIRRLPKKEFVDPCLVLAFQKKGEGDLKKDPQLLQRLFEGACARDLKIYSSGSGGKVKYYEDRFGLKSDLVLFNGKGKYALIQCRLGSKDAKFGEKQLLELKRKILIYDSRNPDKMIGLPSFLMVLTNDSKAYRSGSGVYFCPLSCLGE